MFYSLFLFWLMYFTKVMATCRATAARRRPGLSLLFEMYLLGTDERGRTRYILNKIFSFSFLFRLLRCRVGRVLNSRFCEFLRLIDLFFWLLSPTTSCCRAPPAQSSLGQMEREQRERNRVTLCVDSLSPEWSEPIKEKKKSWRRKGLGS